MPVLDRKECPKCKKGTGTKHCAKSPYCTWFVCTKCSPRNMQLIFDPKGRFFSWGS